MVRTPPLSTRIIHILFILPRLLLHEICTGEMIGVQAGSRVFTIFLSVPQSGVAGRLQ